MNWPAAHEEGVSAATRIVRIALIRIRAAMASVRARSIASESRDDDGHLAAATGSSQ
jgi:hypothetical protein